MRQRPRRFTCARKRPTQVSHRGCPCRFALLRNIPSTLNYILRHLLRWPISPAVLSSVSHAKFDKNKNANQCGPLRPRVVTGNLNGLHLFGILLGEETMGRNALWRGGADFSRRSADRSRPLSSKRIDTYLSNLVGPTHTTVPAPRLNILNGDVVLHDPRPMAKSASLMSIQARMWRFTRSLPAAQNDRSRHSLGRLQSTQCTIQCVVESYLLEKDL